jgi:hypothetical protein
MSQWHRGRRRTFEAQLEVLGVRFPARGSERSRSLRRLSLASNACYRTCQCEIQVGGFVILIFLGQLLMQFDLLGAAVRLLILAAIPSIMASAALIAIIVCRQKITEFFWVSSASKLTYEVREGLSNDTVILVLFAIAEFSLTGSAIMLLD